jgi:Concanavalin A-like lectin/glucanases superfamily
MRLAAATTVLFLALTACGDGPTAPAGPPTEGLILFMPFANGANDASGAGFNGTLLGAATASGELIVGDNDTDALSIPGSAMNELISFTFSAWVRLDLLRDQDRYLVSAANSFQDDEFGVWYRELTGQWVIGFDGSEDGLLADPSIKDMAWHHIVVVRSFTAGAVYVDGRQLGQPLFLPDTPLAVDTNGLILGQDQDMPGGGFASDESWAGGIDNLRIYSRALSVDEIALLFGESR